jgi:hypothetical protein
MFEHFTRQPDSTHCVIYSTPDTGELLVSYWPTRPAAESERDEVLRLGSPHARVESLAELDALN